MRVGVFAIVCVVVAQPLALAADPAPPTGPAWDAWREAIGKRFAHGRIKFGLASLPSVLAGGGTFRKGCPEAPFQRGGLSAMVRSPDRKVFGDVEISIYALDAGGDGYGFLREALARHPEDDVLDEPCAFVGNTAVSFIQAGRFWLEVRGFCGDGALYRYEVGEVLAMLRQKDPASAPTRFGWTGCGEGTPKLVPVDEFLGRLAKKASFWGRAFPEARDEARKRLVRQPTPEPPPVR